MTTSNGNSQNGTSNSSAQEMTLQQLFERSPDAILLLDGERFIDCNPAAVEMLRAANKEEVLHLHPGQLSPEFQPDGSLSAEKADEMMQAAFDQGNRRFEWVHRRVDGQDFQVEVTLTAVPWAGRQMLYTQWRDISKQKQLEQQTYESLERRGQQVALSTQVSQEIAAAENMAELFRQVVALVQERFDYYHAHVYTLEDEALVMQAGTGQAGRQMKEAGHQIELAAAQSLVARAARSGRPVLVPDVTQEPGWLPNPLLPETQAEVAVPIKLGEQVLGVLDVQNDAVGSLTEEDQLLLLGLCGQIAVAIDQRRAEVGRVEMEQALQASQERFALAVQGSNDGIWDWKVQTNEVFYSKRLKEMVGYDEDEFTDSFTEFEQRLHPEDYDRVLQFVTDYLEGREPVYAVEFRFRHKDGSYRWILSRGEVIRDEAGIPLRMAGSHTDITERKEAEAEQKRLTAELESEQSTLRAILENIPLGVYVAEVPTGKPLLTNQRAEEMLGRGISADAGPEELAEVYAAYRAGTAEAYPQLEMPLVRGMGGEITTVDDMEIRRPDGSNILLQVFGAPIVDAAGQIVASVAIFQDITEQKQAAAERSRLSAILEATSDFVGMVDPEGQSLYVNKAGREMIGIGLDEDITSLPIVAYHPERVLPFMVEEAIPTAVREGLWSGENTFLSRDGREIPILQVLIAQKTAEGQVDYFATIARDITEQKLAEERLRRNEARLSDALDIANAAYWEFDLATQTFLFNDQLYSLFHTNVAQEGDYRMSVETFAAKYVHPEDVPFVAKGFQEAAEATDPNFLFQRDFRVICADGEMRTHLVRFRVEKDEQGQTVTIVGANEDITEAKEATERIARQAADLQTVAELSVRIATTLNEQELLQSVADLTKEGFDLYHAHIYLLNKADDTLNLAAGAGEVGRQMVAEGWRIPLEREHSLVARAARSGQGAISNDVRQEPDFLPNPLLPDTRAEMAIPIIAEGKVIGVLDVQADMPDRFTEEDVRIKTTLASQVAVALQNARLFERSEQALAELDDLTRRLTREGWEEYFQAREKTELGYVYDLHQVSPVGPENPSESDGANGKLTQPLTIRGETIGQLALADPQTFGDEAADIIDAVAERLVAHLENLRLAEQTQVALAEVQQSQQFLRTIIDNIPNPVFFKDVDGAYIGFNQAFLDYIGQTEEGLLGKTVYDLNTDQALADKYHQMDMDLIHNPGTQTYEANVKYADGTLRDVIFTKATFNNPDGSLGGLVGAMLDITDRKQAEIELSETTSFLDSIIENLPTMLFVKDAEELRFVRWNKAGEELLGYSREDMVGKNDHDFFPEEEADFFTAKDREVLAGGQMVDIPEEPIDTLHQGTRILHTRKIPILGTDGEPKYLLGLSEDITDRKQAEEALRISEERFALAVRGSHDGIWDWDIANGTLFWSPRLKELLGYADDELEVDFEVFASLLHPDDVDTQAALDAHLKEGVPYDIEQRMRHKSGEYRWMRVRGQAVWDENGQPIRMVGSTSDITESKQAEQALRESEAQLSEALGIAQLGYWEFDVETQMFTFNDQIYGIYHTTVEQEGGYQMAAADFARRFVHPEDAASVGSEIAGAMETTDPDYTANFVNRIICPDGQQIHVAVQIRIIKDEQGRTIKMYGTNQDITSQQEAEAERERLLREVEAAYRQYIQQEWQQFLGKQHHGRYRIEHQQAGLPPEQSDNGRHQTAIEAPIALRGQQIGSLRLEDADPARQWSREEQALVEAVSQQLAQTVENLRLFEDTRQRAGREQLTRYITDKMRAAPDADSIIQVGIQELARVLDSSHVVVELDASGDGQGMAGSNRER